LSSARYPCIQGQKEGGVKVVGVYIGKPRMVTAPGGSCYTGGAKTAVPSAFVTMEGFEGDGQGNLKHHGGRDRTVCVYPAERYAWWRRTAGIELPFGAFSENLVIEGAGEDSVCIGDIYRAGNALLQCSLPRDPCRTIDRLTGVDGLWQQARDAGACGFHMRTLEEGLVTEGCAFTLEKRHPEGITVSMALDLYHGRSRDTELAARLCGMPELAAEGRRAIMARLAL
jgi:MOSC domain-containing protein YiiM